MTRFVKVIPYILDEEGGYSNDPRDSGSETNFGISKRAYPCLNIKTLTPEKAIEIYRVDYWAPIKGDELPAGVDLIMLDCAVNQGVDIAIRFLQEACGTVVDGVFGPITLGRVHSMSAAVLLERIAAYRATRYAGTKNFNVFGRGWMLRLLRQVVAAAGMVK